MISMRYPLAIALLLAAVSCGGGAVPRPTDAHLARARARWPDTTRASLERGRELYVARCSGCHSGSGPAPGRAALKGRSHASIVEALTTGKMMAQGRALSDEDKNNVATFLTQGPA